MGITFHTFVHSVHTHKSLWTHTFCTASVLRYCAGMLLLPWSFPHFPRTPTGINTTVMTKSSYHSSFIFTTQMSYIPWTNQFWLHEQAFSFNMFLKNILVHGMCRFLPRKSLSVWRVISPKSSQPCLAHRLPPCASSTVALAKPLWLQFLHLVRRWALCGKAVATELSSRLQFTRSAIQWVLQECCL